MNIKSARFDGDSVFVVAGPCVFCGGKRTFELDSASFVAWQDGKHIQNAFPDMSSDDRETLISGTCGPCWDKLWGGR